MKKKLYVINLHYKISFNSYMIYQYNYYSASHCAIRIRHIYNFVAMKWPRYRRVTSLEIQLGITSQINKCANTDPRTYQRRDHVRRRSKHPLPTGHTRCDPSSIIMNAELSAVKVSLPSTI
jgi:hypothetical protein